MRKFLILCIALTPSLGLGSDDAANEIIKSFQRAGLEAENPQLLGRKQRGFAPLVCEATHFTIPSLCHDCGGRVFVCPNDNDRDLIASYYINFGRRSASLYSHVFVKGNIVIQINGELDDTTAKKYEQALP